MIVINNKEREEEILANFCFKTLNDMIRKHRNGEDLEKLTHNPSSD